MYTKEFDEWLSECPHKFEITDEIDDCVFLFVRNALDDDDE